MKTLASNPAQFVLAFAAVIFGTSCVSSQQHPQEYRAHAVVDQALVDPSK